MKSRQHKSKVVSLSRRAFIGGAASAFTIVPRHVLGGDGHIAPSAKTTIACIGVGGQGQQNMDAFLRFPEMQVVAVCDVNREGGGYLSWNWNKGQIGQVAGREPARRKVDEYYAKQQPSGKYKGCRAYTDYRELLDKEDVDAVMIATPDHTHAVITMDALKRRKHVYCEKPLAWSVEENRKVTEAARAAGVATQLGNHGQASTEARVSCEMIAAGAIGNVREVHAFYGARFWKTALYETRPPDTPPVPDGLDWDLWLGPAHERPYHPEYHPWCWRNWWDFGTGLIGDLGCHKLSTVFKALKLGYPVAVEACSTKLNSETHPQGVMSRFEFPARGVLPPVVLNWYDGGLRPPRPQELEAGRPWGNSGVLYVGDKGKMLGHRLIPETSMRAFGKAPQILPRSPGHYKEFVDACRGGPPAGSNFVDHSGLLSETCMLGNVAVRARKKLHWDGPGMKVTNDVAANAFLRRDYRAGWTL
ncbi:MAG: Gfo/Idh/MocA family oxidoreductase [Kiritimatiellae bacterium]|nr:Gfo/Idh/MocA family oxidoreductase [Kiritimatiellia bacterium]